MDFWCLDACAQQVFAPVLDWQVIISYMAKKKDYSTLDISSAFMCMEMSKQMATFFAFQHEGRFFVLNWLPFGDHNSMNLFLRAINFTLIRVRQILCHQVPDDILSSYADDLCLGTDNHHTHYKVLKILLQEFQSNGWHYRQTIVIFTWITCDFWASIFLIMNWNQTTNFRPIWRILPLLVPIPNVPIQTFDRFLAYVWDCRHSTLVQPIQSHPCELTRGGTIFHIQTTKFLKAVVLKH